MDAKVSLMSNPAAAASEISGTYESYPIDRGTLDLGGVVALIGFYRDRASYVVLFTYGRAAFQLEMGFTLSSSTTQRLQAAPVADSFARTFYRNLLASQPAP